MPVEVKINRKAIGQLLRDPRTIEGPARRILAAAGPGHRLSIRQGATRVRAIIITDTAEARLAEAEDRNLSKALEAGRRG